MKVKVNKDECISCGMCIDICPEVFSYDEEDKSQVTCEDVSNQLEEKVLEAKNSCPVDAIEAE